MSSVLLGSPGFLFPSSPPPIFCAPFCFQWAIPLTLFTGLLSRSWSWFAYSLREPKVDIHPPQGRLYANHLPVDKHEAQHPHPEYKTPWGIFYTLGPPCGICTFAGLLPFHIQHMQLTCSFSGRHFLTNDLSTNLPWGNQANPHWCNVLCEA